MANEIVALEGMANDGYRLLFLYPIAAPATYDDGLGVTQTVVPTPAPTDGLASDVLTAAEKASLDAGDLAYEEVTIIGASGLTNPQLLARAQEVYASKLAAFQARYADRYHSKLGQRFNA